MAKTTDGGEDSPVKMGLLFFGCIALFFFVSKMLGGGNSALVGKSAPELSLPTLTTDGKIFKTADYKGKPILLDFWASWCGPCRAQAPIIDRVAKTFASDGLVVVGVNTSDQEEDARDYVRTHSFSYPIAFDADRSAGNAYGVTSFPTMVLVGKDGQVKAVRTGVTSADTLAALVRDAL